MHIPNGFLDPKTSAGAAFAAAAVLGYCFAKVRQALTHLVPEAALAGVGNVAVNISEGSKRALSAFAENHIAKMAAVASLIFAAQMFNFPVDNGTSGHLLGGILAALVVGPFSGTIVIAAVLAVQSVFFADGGILALGANILNMAVLGTFVAYYLYFIIHKILKNQCGFYLGIGVASFLSVLLASIACAFEIAFSGTVELGKILPAMASIHARIGLAEAFISILIIEYVRMKGFKLEGGANG